MPIQERAQTLADIAAGKLALSEFLSLSSNDLRSVARLGASAYEGQRFDLAIAVFTALEALDPGDSIHIVHRAHSEAAAGKNEDALDSIHRYLERDHLRPKDETASMFLLRASLSIATDRAFAERDL